MKPIYIIVLCIAALITGILIGKAKYKCNPAPVDTKYYDSVVDAHQRRHDSIAVEKEIRDSLITEKDAQILELQARKQIITNENKILRNEINNTTDSGQLAILCRLHAAMRQYQH